MVAAEACVHDLAETSSGGVPDVRGSRSRDNPQQPASVLAGILLPARPAMAVPVLPAVVLHQVSPEAAHGLACRPLPVHMLAVWQRLHEPDTHEGTHDRAHRHQLLHLRLWTVLPLQGAAQTAQRL